MLVNNMFVDGQGGVQIKKHYSYYTYTKINSGTTCTDTTGYTSGYTLIDTYILPYKNTNEHYTTETYNQDIVLFISGVTISDWIVDYINSIATTGYTSIDGYINEENENIEDRVILDALGDFYKIDNGITGSTNNNAMWAIYDTIEEDYWTPDSGNNYYYDETDDCAVPTGRKIVTLIDLNSFSPTYLNYKYIEKCSDGVMIPMIETVDITEITATTARPFGNVLSENGSSITERGFCYSTFSNPSVNDIKIIEGSTIGEYDIVLTSLVPNTNYYVRAYAVNGVGINYGKEITFKTLA